MQNARTEAVQSVRKFRERKGGTTDDVADMESGMQDKKRKTVEHNNFFRSNSDGFSLKKRSHLLVSAH